MSKEACLQLPAKSAHVLALPLPSLLRAASNKPTYGHILKKKGIAYEAHYRNEYTMRMGYLLNAYGIPCRKPRNGPPGSLPTTTAMRQASSAHATGTTTGHNTRPLTGNSFASSEEEGYANVAEIEKFLASQALFRQNIITRQCEVAFTTTDDLFGKPA